MAISLEKKLEERRNLLKEDETAKETEETVKPSTSCGSEITIVNTEEEILPEKSTITPSKDANSTLHLDTSITSTLTAFGSKLPSLTSFSLQTSPSLDALNEINNQSLYLSPISARNSPRKDEEIKTLIRSNSYTIEKPSPLLMQFIESDGYRSPSKSTTKPANRLSLENWNNYVSPLSTPKVIKEKPPRKFLPKSVSPVTSVFTSTKSNIKPHEIKSDRSTPRITPKEKDKEIKTKSAIIKTKENSNKKLNSKEEILRSIYGKSNHSIRSSLKSKKSSENKSEISVSASKNVQKCVTNNVEAANTTSANEFERILKIIEEQHNAQMQQLIQRQFDAQQKMKIEFARQQENLLTQITQMTLKKDIAPSVPIVDFIDNNNCVDCCESTDCDDAFLSTSRDYNANQEEFTQISTPNSMKCQRRLVYYDDNKMVSDDLNRLNCLKHLPTNDEIHAAMVITAYAKGFLTRRLFRTGKIQNIVKTIRDTLLFILDIHYEHSAIDNDSPADLKLKTHLIQQVFQQILNSNFTKRSFSIRFISVFSFSHFTLWSHFC